jgi:hypothetical protein
MSNGAALSPNPASPRSMTPCFRRNAHSLLARNYFGLLPGKMLSSLSVEARASLRRSKAFAEAGRGKVIDSRPVRSCIIESAAP